jgi:hypothetical protein
VNGTGLNWFKSSYGSGPGEDRVEAALSWHRSSHGSGGDGDCVEAAPRADAVHVRDSKVRQGPRFAVSPTAWAGFLPYATRG